jgi:hypothetical protein
MAYYLNGDAAIPEPMSEHTHFTEGCWYGEDGWIECDEETDADTDSDSDTDSDTDADSDTDTDTDTDSDSDSDADADPGDSCDYHVPADKSTIQSAINATSDGDTVCVAAGSYHEDLDFGGKDIIVQSDSGASRTTLYGVGTGIYDDAVVMFNDGETSSAVLEGFTLHGTAEQVIEVEFSGATLKNLVIECDGVSAQGFLFDGAVDVDVKNTTVKGCDSYGFYVMGSTNIDLNNVIVSDNLATGIRMGADSYVYIGNSVFYENGFIGIRADAAEVTVENSIVVGHSTYGIYLEDTSYSADISYSTLNDNASSYSSAVGVGSGNDIDDPEFTSASSEDFTLRSSSPCINDGDPSSSMNDADRTRNDKGAYGGPLSENW